MSLRPTLTDVRAYGEYSTTFRWALTMLTPPRFMGNEPPGFNILCESTDLPSKTVDKILIGLRGHKHYQPGIVTPAGSIQFNFVETTYGHVHQWLLAWQEAIWRHNIGVGETYDNLVAEKVAITRFDNQDVPVCTYILRYCFLENYSFPRMDGTTSGPFNISATLAYDDFYVRSASNAYLNSLVTDAQLDYRNVL